MDPFSQAFLGSWAAMKIAAKKENLGKAAICGTIGGLLPDIDIFIRSISNPLLAIEYHRHFTHSLFFIPFGGFIAAILCVVLFWLLSLLTKKSRTSENTKKSLHFFTIYIFTSLGYATHGLLDAMTSYGTHLAWPFSNHRTSWSIISIIDLAFTLPMIIAVIISTWRRSKIPLYIFSLYGTLYLGFGFIQKQRVTDAMYELAASRGHYIEHQEVKPTFGNNILWRTIYKSGNIIYIDAIRSNIWGDIKLYLGEKALAVEPSQDFLTLPKNSILYQDIKKFDFFSNNLLVKKPEFPNIIIDARYSPIAYGTTPMWGIKYDISKPDSHAEFIRFPREVNELNFKNFIKMIIGIEPRRYDRFN